MWWSKVVQAFENAADLVREYLGIGSSVEPIPGFESDPDGPEVGDGDIFSETTQDTDPYGGPVEFDEYVSSGVPDQDWESDPDDEAWPGDDELKYAGDVDEKDVRGYFGTRDEANIYASDIPVPTSVWFDPEVGAWWVEVDYEE